MSKDKKDTNRNDLPTGNPMFEGGLEALSNYLKKFGKDNESVQGLIHGGLVDSALTQVEMGQSLNYNQLMGAEALKLNEGLEALKTGNQLTLMGTEADLAEDLIGAQGDEQVRGIKATGEEQRKGFSAQGTEDRL
ncbi:MAG TPA: hypothetical protein DEP13_08100, partial [Gammaproteobacteria bacterium]|nr:hypothetical protein [Gammaproteobacteria bacterium]